MRLLLRILFALMFVVGALLALVSPWFADNVRGYEIGKFQLFQAPNVWKTAQVVLKPGDAPVFVTVLMRVAQEFQPAKERIVLRLTGKLGDDMIVEREMTFADGPPTKKSPQAVEATYREGSGSIDTVNPGTYVFMINPGDTSGLTIEAVELLLHAGGLDIDPRAQPAGFVLMALGFIGLVLAMRRLTGTKPRNPNEQPPIRKWGRGGGG